MLKYVALFNELESLIRMDGSKRALNSPLFVN